MYQVTGFYNNVQPVTELRHRPCRSPYLCCCSSLSLSSAHAPSSPTTHTNAFSSFLIILLLLLLLLQQLLLLLLLLLPLLRLLLLQLLLLLLTKEHTYLSLIFSIAIIKHKIYMMIMMMMMCVCVRCTGHHHTLPQSLSPFFFTWLFLHSSMSTDSQHSQPAPSPPPFHPSSKQLSSDQLHVLQVQYYTYACFHIHLPNPPLQCHLRPIRSGQN